jgi:hypothetical protein
MRLHGVITTSGMPSAAAIFGTSGSAQLLNQINNNLGSTNFFGSASDAYASVTKSFMDNIVAPIKRTIHAMANTITSLSNPNVYRQFTTPDDFKYIPPVMMDPILYHDGVRRFGHQGRLELFGYDPIPMSEENPYMRLINNGTVRDVLEEANGNSHAELTWEYTNYDPVVSENELLYIESAYAIMEKLLLAGVDPTNYPSQIK